MVRPITFKTETMSTENAAAIQISPIISTVVSPDRRNKDSDDEKKAGGYIDTESHLSPVKTVRSGAESARDQLKSLEVEATCDKTGQAKTTVSRTAAIILTLALGAHAFFEGIAFGLQTTVDSAWQLAAGIIIHKAAAAISLGGAFARTGYTLREISLFLLIFALIAPIGIAIGMSIADSNKLVDVIFMGISGGTFIYVACSEIVVNEFATGRYQSLKAFLVFLGGLIITCLWFFGEHAHDHGCDMEEMEGMHDMHDH